MSDHTRVLVVDTDGGRAASLVELLALAGCNTRQADAYRKLKKYRDDGLIIRVAG
jgi:DNA-binding NtrC family response regulator